ncbi:metal-dependent transcriptional regulator [Geomonas sp. RF6]|uniref:metal-dependent transcriptional regulator n=1 Tax=Geomonas sp. RF6 TaxID=2897342 RepID=UPI001E3CF160|nr:metal-dependent transcriptional regulator [Geomonas sp. RF6]UFS71329.1 metal-dependent transcriptional regulator [Geomonas sp. RF6]
MKLTDHAEEILESLWIEAVEEGHGHALLSTLKLEPQDDGVAELLTNGLIEVKDARLFFTRTGREEGRTTIRRHRLAERLMMDIFGIHGQSGDDKACQFEHLLNEGVDTKVCTMLNHPTTCPHGKPIPPGACCEEARKAGDLGVVPLTELKCAEEGDIAYIQTDDSKKMQKLMAMGVLPGNRIVLVQSFPSYVFRVGYSEFAIDSAMAREIFVRK